MGFEFMQTQNPVNFSFHTTHQTIPT